MAKKPAPAPDGTNRLIGLVRVSTGKQEDSGLGLDAQRPAIESYRAMVGGICSGTYTEVESGMHDDIESRPQLRAAVADAALARARLVIAKIDRLVRSIPVMAYLKQSGVQFVACDNPHANELTIDILVAVAADEGRRISQRHPGRPPAPTGMGGACRSGSGPMYPDGVPRRRRRGPGRQARCPAPRVPQPDRRGPGQGTGRPRPSARRLRARTAYVHLEPVMHQLRADGLSYQAIADRLNDLGHRTANGAEWNGGQVHRLIGPRPD